MTQQVVGTHILKYDENGISGVRLCADSTMITSPIWYTQMLTQMAYVCLHSPPKNYPNVTVNRPVAWIPYGKNHHQIQAQFPRRSCRVCVPGTIVFVPGGSLEVSFIKSTSRWEMRGSCRWRWWVVLIPRDYPEFGFDGDGSSDLCLFFEKALFLKYRFFITKQLLLEEKCYSILVNISCDGNTFQLQFLCFFSVLTVKYNQLSTIAPLRSGLKWWKTRRWAALLGSCVWNSFLNLFAEK